MIRKLEIAEFNPVHEWLLLRPACRLRNFLQDRRLDKRLIFNVFRTFDIPFHF